MNKNRIIFFDIFRIFSLFLVIIAHLGQYFSSPIGGFFGIKNFYYITLGGLGVTFFIILSGMVLESNYHDKGFSFSSFITFITKRAKRIYIPFWLAIVITILLSGKMPVINFTLALDLSNLLVFTGKPWSMMLLPTAWFLGVILFLYLIYPIFHYLFKNHNIHLVIITLLVIEIVSRFVVGLNTNPSGRMLDWFVLNRVFEFGFGIWLIRSGAINSLIKLEINSELINKMVSWISSFTFPFYLIHWPVLYSPIISSNSKTIFIIKFFILTFLFAFVIYNFDKIIQKKVIHHRSDKPLTHQKV